MSAELFFAVIAICICYDLVSALLKWMVSDYKDYLKQQAEEKQRRENPIVDYRYVVDRDGKRCGAIPVRLKDQQKEPQQ